MAVEETAAWQRRCGQPSLRGQIVVQVGGRVDWYWSGKGGGRLRHSSEQWHIWGSTPHPHPQPPPRGPASLPCEHRKRCVNFCLVPLSPSSSKWSTSTTVRGEQGEADWAGSREVGGGGGWGGWTPHTDFLCARGRGLQYYSDRGGVGGGALKWVEHNRRERPHCWFVNTVEHIIMCLYWKCHLPVRFCSAIT